MCDPAGVCVWWTQRHPGDPGDAAQPAANAAAVHARCACLLTHVDAANCSSRLTLGCSNMQCMLMARSCHQLLLAVACRRVHCICHRVMVLLLGCLHRVREQGASYQGTGCLVSSRLVHFSCVVWTVELTSHGLFIADTGRTATQSRVSTCGPWGSGIGTTRRCPRLHELSSREGHGSTGFWCDADGVQFCP